MGVEGVVDQFDGRSQLVACRSSQDIFVAECESCVLVGVILISGGRSVSGLDVVLLCGSGIVVAEFVRIVVLGVALKGGSCSVLRVVVVLLSGSGVVDVWCVLPSSGVMLVYPSGWVLSLSVRGLSRCFIGHPGMALVYIMSVSSLVVVLMVSVLHHRCRMVHQVWLCRVLMSICVHRVA